MLKNPLFYILCSCIMMISFFGNRYVFEIKNTESLGKIEKAILLAVWFLAIAILGCAALNITKRNWANALWKLQYVFVLILCVVYAGVYFFASSFPIAIKTAMASIRNFYLTPLPFALIVMMIVVENKKSSSG